MGSPPDAELLPLKNRLGRLLPRSERRIGAAMASPHAASPAQLTARYVASNDALTSQCGVRLGCYYWDPPSNPR